MTEEKGMLHYISEITEINDTSEYMDDEHLDQALGQIIKLIMKPDIPPTTVPKLIVQLESIAATLNMKKTYYSTIDKGKTGTPQNNKKNVYFSAVESIHRVCDGLKYLARQNV